MTLTSHTFDFSLPQTTRRVDVPLGPAFDAWHLPLLTRSEFRRLGMNERELSEEQLRYLARFGLLAPTTHNTVPQRFRFASSGELELWVDRTFVLPQSDGNGRQATISCGCVLGYLNLAAAALGWKLHVMYDSVVPKVAPIVPSEARYSRLARLHFSPDDCGSDNGWLSAMLERKSVRAEFDPDVSLVESVEQEMASLVASYPQTRLHVLRDPASLTVLGKFQEMADITVYNRESFATELGRWLLANDDGLPLGMRGREFGLSDESAQRLHCGLLGQLQLLPDEVGALAKSANKAMRSASAVAILTVANDTVVQRLDAGRAFGELALLLHRRGYVTAMHAAITEVEGPNMALRARLRTTARPVVLFRIGKPAHLADALRPHSARPPLETLILSSV